MNWSDTTTLLLNNFFQMFRFVSIKNLSFTELPKEKWLMSFAELLLILLKLLFSGLSIIQLILLTYRELGR